MSEASTVDRRASVTPDRVTPKLWASVAHRKMLAITTLLRTGQSLLEADCRDITDWFVYPNLVHWVLEMGARKSARAYERACPLFADERDCRLGRLNTAGSMPEGHLGDLCRFRESAHPWALQVTLIFNEHRAWRENKEQERSHPSRECALGVWRRIVRNPAVKRRWNACPVDSRRDGLSDFHAKIVEGLWQAAGHFQSAEDPATMVCRLVSEASVRRYCRRMNQLIDYAKRQQMAAAGAGIGWSDQQAEKIVVDFLRSMRTCAAMRRAFSTQRYRSEVVAFLNLLRDCNLPGKTEVDALLGQQQVPLADQQKIFDFIENRLLPDRNRRLPPGDPLDDPLIQDLFWYPMGDWGTSGASSGGMTQGRTLFDWTRSRWSCVGEGVDAVPAWRTRP